MSQYYVIDPNSPKLEPRRAQASEAGKRLKALIAECTDGQSFLVPNDRLKRLAWIIALRMGKKAVTRGENGAFRIYILVPAEPEKIAPENKPLPL